MAEYLLLATFIAVLSTLTLWTIRTLNELSRACYLAILPSRKGKNIKSAAAEEHLPTLSEALAGIPMPWGWQPLGLARVPGHTITLHPRPVAVPWGWPGNPRHINRNRHGQRPKFGMVSALRLHRVHPASSPVPVRAQSDPDEALILDVRGTQHGGFQAIMAVQGSIRNARLPWGW